MRLVVYPHSLDIGGSQLNAVEVAAEIRDRGHEVTIFGVPGPLVARVQELRLPFVPSPRPRRRPTPGVIGALERVVRDTRADVLHAHEWPPGLEAYLTGLRLRVPVMCSVMSMSVAGFLPSDLPVLVGTAQMAAHERARGRRSVGLVEPCVDVVHNAPGAVDPGRFRRQYGLDDGRPTVVVVSRLAHELKLEGILAAVEAVGRLSAGTGARLVVVGDGPARPVIEEAAARADATYGPGTVVLTGQIDDPRPAYAAADVALGMGGSALRAMAFARPLVVQGEQGFFRRLGPDSVDEFLWQGWYGVGRSREDGARALAVELAPLLADAGLRRELGEFARRTVVDRFSVAAAASATLDLAGRLGAPPGRPAAVAAAVARYASYGGHRVVARVLGRAASDDFNARPVAALPGAPARPSVNRPATIMTDSTAATSTPSTAPPGGTT